MKKVIIGIQGGKGSFNEEAIRYYTKQHSIDSFELKYLHTTHRVLEELDKGLVDLGQFAIHNSTGGVVWETVQAMGQFKFNVQEEFAIIISHALMIRSDTTLSNIDTIMTHPQVLKQCAKTLSQKYPNLTQTSGTGEMIDHAVIAEHLSKRKLAKNIATMGSKVLADIFKLTIVEDNLQDLDVNYTSFLIVKK